jgi:hypothetical protein
LASRQGFDGKALLKSRDEDVATDHRSFPVVEAHCKPMLSVASSFTGPRYLPELSRRSLAAVYAIDGIGTAGNDLRLTLNEECMACK